MFYHCFPENLLAYFDLTILRFIFFLAVMYFELIRSLFLIGYVVIILTQIYNPLIFIQHFIFLNIVHVLDNPGNSFIREELLIPL
jgi:hypothetical protein